MPGGKYRNDRQLGLSGWAAGANKRAVEFPFMVRYINALGIEQELRGFIQPDGIIDTQGICYSFIVFTKGEPSTRIYWQDGEWFMNASAEAVLAISEFIQVWYG